MPNRLAHARSPYLRQHADNPVEWHEWGPEAFARARAEDKPVLLSIGYAACHWCHVMAHESFEDAETAALMNAWFVNVKVDREERPDVDHVYMQATQAMTGHGGWPMTCLVTPDGEPFFAGTYFPPDDRHGMPSFRRVLTALHDLWTTQRPTVGETAAAMRNLYAQEAAPLRAGAPLDAATLAHAHRTLAGAWDARHAGFGGAPKFPPTMALEFLLTRWARTGDAVALAMVRDTVRAMAWGGIHDHVGGGIHRYSVDAQWLVPHFEKMLYDNALLARLGAHLWQAEPAPWVATFTRGILDWAIGEMCDPAGGFYASLDADSDGHEGVFYTWTEAELRAALGGDADALLAFWGVTPSGNFEGRSILHQRREATAAEAAALPRAVAALRAVRARRVRPGLDDKVLAGWNGLMLRAVATAARVFDDAGYAEVARRNGAFLRREMLRDGRVWRSWHRGVTAIPGFLEDHAAVGLGFLELWHLTFDRAWLDAARTLADTCVARFWSDAHGAFFDTADDAEPLITRPRDLADNASPGGTSLAVELLLRIAVLTGDPDADRRARFVLDALAEPMARHASGFGNLLTAADLAVHGAVEVAYAGHDGLAALRRAEASVYVPALVLAGGGYVDVPLLAGRTAAVATAYVCRHFACDAPTADPAVLARQLVAARRA
jgi:hypothetical protein